MPTADPNSKLISFHDADNVYLGANQMRAVTLGRVFLWRASDVSAILSDWTVTNSGLTMYDGAYGNGAFVTVGPGRPSYRSTDAINWSEGYMVADIDWNCVEFGNGLFVATSSATVDYLATSTDGLAWTPRSLPRSGDYDQVVYGNGKFVGIAGSFAITSSDGITWTDHPMPAGYNWFGLTYGNGIFVAVAFGSDKAATSSDGINWAIQTLPSVAEWRAVVYGTPYGSGLFVAVGDGRSARSTDGISWAESTMPFGGIYYDVVYGDRMFVAVAGFETAFSSDGINWAEKSSAIGLYKITYGIAQGTETFLGLPSVLDAGNYATATPGELAQVEQRM